MKKNIRIVSVVLMLALLCGAFSVSASTTNKSAYEKKIEGLNKKDSGKQSTTFASMEAHVVNGKLVIDLLMKETKYEVWYMGAVICYDTERVRPVTETGRTDDKTKVAVNWPEFDVRNKNLLDCTAVLGTFEGAKGIELIASATDPYNPFVSSDGPEVVISKIGKTYRFSGLTFDILDDTCTEFGFYFDSEQTQTLKKDDYLYPWQKGEYLMVYRSKQNYRAATKDTPASFDWVYTTNMQTGEIGRTTVYYGDPIDPSDPSTLKLGDVNGDRMIDAFDYQMLKAHVLGTYADATDDQLSRMNVNRDKIIDAFDFQMLKAHVLGTYVIE